MPAYVEVAVNVPQVSGEFHYHLPDHLEGQVRIGQLVQVPFGHQTVQGIITGFVDRPEVAETRPVSEIIDPAAVLTETQIQFANRLAESTLSSLSACIGLMLPPGIAQQADVLYTALSNQYTGLTKAQVRVLNLLNKRGPMRGQQLDRSLSRMNWRAAARALVQKGLVRSERVLPAPKVRPKTVRTVKLACPADEAESRMSTLARGITTIRLSGAGDQSRANRDALGRPGTRARQRREALLEHLIEHPGETDSSNLYKKFNANRGDLQKLVDLGLAEIGSRDTPVTRRRKVMLRYLIRETEPVEATWLYAESGGNLADLRAMEKGGLVVFGEKEVWRDPVDQLDLPLATPPVLTDDQQKVWGEVELGLRQAVQGEPVPAYLLHGVTGSGKTEIYLRAVRLAIDLGRQAIVLVPEIALTPQTVRRFAARFEGQVGLLHSGLSQGERYDTWRRARAGELAAVVGPRSALFTPFANLGLIIIDEFHDDTYYQMEPEPHYHTRDAAIRYARLAGALCLMGSATPDVVSQFRAQSPSSHQSQYIYLSLPNRILAHRAKVQAQLDKLSKSRPGSSRQQSHYQPLEAEVDSIDLPPVHVVDMRQELQSGNRSIFSRELHQALSDILAANEQAILFLNRRGTATYVFCRDCGESLQCPRCEIPLTYHGKREKLICHRCGYQRNNPSTCPKCRSERIRHYGTGTQKVESEVQAIFPGVRTLRWDHETTRKKGAHDLILSHFAGHRADILIGTQMLAKGLDLPLVTLVGVVLADVGLNLPDFRAAERTFQVLTQVAGRAGRSPLGGKVVLQTFQPEHYVIQSAAGHDYHAFYELEISHRRRLGYPPFSQIVRLLYRDLDQEKAHRAAVATGKNVRRWLDEEGRRATKMVGPVPCFFSRLRGYYRWQIVLSGPDPASLLRGRSLPDWKVYVNPPNLL